MPMIRPSTDLRNNYNHLSEFVNQTNEPVFITKNGKGDTVLISNEMYDRLIGLEELRQQVLQDLIEKANRAIEEANAVGWRSKDDVLAELLSEKGE